MRVYPVPDGVVIRWGEYQNEIHLERSVHTPFNFVHLADVTGRTYYKDEEPVLETFPNLVWYRLVDGEGRVLEEEQSVNLDDPLLKEVVRRAEVFLKEAGGRPIAILSLRVGGRKCPRCYDENLKKPTDPRCPVCFGTGWEGGYFEPVLVYGRKQGPRQRGRNQTEPIIQIQNSFVFLLPSIFPVSPRDVLVDMQEGGLYRATRVVEHTLYSAVLYQEVYSVRLHPQAPEYQMDFSSLQKDLRERAIRPNKLYDVQWWL